MDAEEADADAKKTKKQHCSNSRQMVVATRADAVVEAKGEEARALHSTASTILCWVEESLSKGKGRVISCFSNPVASDDGLQDHDPSQVVAFRQRHAADWSSGQNCKRQALLVAQSQCLRKGSWMRRRRRIPPPRISKA